LKIPSAAAAVLVGLLLSAPAFAQALIRGTLTDTKDGTIGVQTVDQIRQRCWLFLVTKTDMSAIQPGKFSASRLLSRTASASHARLMCLMILCTTWPRGTIHGILTPSRT
jgi:hypothetical protein